MRKQWIDNMSERGVGGGAGGGGGEADGEWRGLQGARGSVYALLSGTRRGKLASSNAGKSLWNVTTLNKQQEAAL